MDIIGKIHSISDPVQITERFSKQNFIIDLSRFSQETGELYENFAEMQINNNKVDMSTFEVGQKVKVIYFISGRFWEKKDGSGYGFFQNLICTAVESIEDNNNSYQSTQSNQAAPVSQNDNEANDLPF